MLLPARASRASATETGSFAEARLRVFPPFAPAASPRPLPTGLSPRGRHARLEDGHEVGELARLGERSRCLDGLALHLRLDDRQEGLAVLVVVAGGIEVAGQGIDELAGHGDLDRLDLDLLLGKLELGEVADLVGPVERREQHRRTEGVERRELLTVLEDDLADRLQLALGEHRAQEREGLAADGLGLEVVGLLDEDGLLLLASRRHELLDLDAPDGLERHGLEVALVDDDVVALRPLVAPDGLRARDLAVLGAVDLHLDAPTILGVEQVEREPPTRLGGQVEPDRDGHQPELDGPAPHRAWHTSSSLPSGLRSQQHSGAHKG